MKTKTKGLILMALYTVEAGDTVNSIAAEFRTSPALIIKDNELLSPDSITVGQSLLIRQPSEIYTVAEGDTLFSLADRFGITLNELYRKNPTLGGIPDVYPGEELVISSSTVPDISITTNGYVYPFVDRDTLRRVLPYLSYLTIFTYGINRDGSLIPPGAPGDEEELISMALEYGTVPIALLSTLTEEGTFSNELAAYIFNNPEIENAVINNIVNAVIRKGYGGVDLDFEYIGKEFADNYAEFVRKINLALDARGNYVTLAALAPKISGTQPGLLYEGHDYGALADAADRVLLMTYEWGYTYGPPMAVAPINEVRRVVDYAMTEMLPEKAILGIPNYGYDWTLPYMRGTSMAKSLSNLDAVRNAIIQGASINYDERAQSPFYYYSTPDGDGVIQEHVVWFEDPRSVTAKLDLLREYSLFGGSVWNVMRWFPQLWLLIDESFRISKNI